MPPLMIARHLRPAPFTSGETIGTVDNIFPPFDEKRQRENNETLLGQRARVVWLYGLSGSGKSTLAAGLGKRFLDEKRVVQLLDGDNIRQGLNKDLGFSDEDRYENIRRIAEIAKLFAHAGIICVSSFITPTNKLRSLARDVVGPDDFVEIYLDCSYEVCRDRDVNGLYAKAEAGLVKNFTGKDSAFEPPTNPPDLVIPTGTLNIEASLERLHGFVSTRIGCPPGLANGAKETNALFSQ